MKTTVFTSSSLPTLRLESSVWFVQKLCLLTFPCAVFKVRLRPASSTLSGRGFRACGTAVSSALSPSLRSGACSAPPSASASVSPEVSSICFQISDPSKRYSVQLSLNSRLFFTVPRFAFAPLLCSLCGICTTLFLTSILPFGCST